MRAMGGMENKVVLPGRKDLVAVCLDIDGVLNPIGADAMAGFTLHALHMPKEDLPAGSPFLRGGGKVDLDLWVHASKEMGQWIEGLRKKADVYWSTTWESAANIHFAPLLGIEPLATIPHSQWRPTFSDIKHGEAGRWKRYALADLFEGRPLVWIDDMAIETDIERWRGKTPTLVVVPNSEIGLSKEQRAEVDEFVSRQARKRVGAKAHSERTGAGEAKRQQKGQARS